MSERKANHTQEPESSPHQSWINDRSHIMGVIGGFTAGLAYPVSALLGIGVGVGALALGAPKKGSRSLYIKRSGLTAAVVFGAMAFSDYNATPQPPELYVNDKHTVITVPTRIEDKEFVRVGDRFMSREDYIAHQELLVRDKENASLDSLVARDRP